MKRSKFPLAAACLALVCLTAGPALAHFGWLSPQSFTPGEGRKLKVMVGWGHHFPMEDFAKADQVEGLTWYDPQGKKMSLPAINDFMFQTEDLKQPGVYMAATQKKAGFFTRLETGFRRGPKTGLKGVKLCTLSHNFMKSIVVVGSGDQGDVSRVVGQELELVPLDNPAKLTAGDDMRIKVLFQGKPVQGYPTVYATYGGFSSELAYAYTSFADKQGIFKLRILKAGTWLVQVKMETPYPDPKECDLNRFNSTLTFMVK